MTIIAILTDRKGFKRIEVIPSIKPQFYVYERPRLAASMVAAGEGEIPPEYNAIKFLYDGQTETKNEVIVYYREF